ncbi:hypothetical protein [Arthrobacter roseus]|uniref:hypothetical protein n=1 Tax=Arthrobacter roseus TaxID=136274 RepID=UPI001962DD97|nr:hypothetical protein [Arthrobacter roseus]MBM7846930.1 hypothetical protein [Arthrobacter roseus]
MDKNNDAESPKDTFIPLDDEPITKRDATPGDESAVSPATRAKYRHLMIAGIVVIVLAVTAVVFIALMIN